MGIEAFGGKCLRGGTGATWERACNAGRSPRALCYGVLRGAIPTTSATRPNLCYDTPRCATQHLPIYWTPGDAAQPPPTTSSPDGFPDVRGFGRETGRRRGPGERGERCAGGDGGREGGGAGGAEGKGVRAEGARTSRVSVVSMTRPRMYDSYTNWRVGTRHAWQVRALCRFHIKHIKEEPR